jgi:hypothetical protein
MNNDNVVNCGTVARMTTLSNKIGNKFSILPGITDRQSTSLQVHNRV